MNDATLVTSNNWSIKTNITNHNQFIFSDQIRQPTRQATFIGAILAFVFIFFGLIGNIILITTILSVKKLRSNIINIFIVSVRDDHYGREEKKAAFISIEHPFLFYLSFPVQIPFIPVFL
jgi:hypothetical protein